MFVEILIGGRSFEQINIMCISENISFNDGMNLGLLIDRDVCIQDRRRQQNCLLINASQWIKYCLQTNTGCPTIEFSLCFACFLGFPCSYRGSFYHFSTAQETTIPKLTLLSSLYQKLIKLQSKTWSNLDLDTI